MSRFTNNQRIHVLAVALSMLAITEGASAQALPGSDLPPPPGADLPPPPAATPPTAPPAPAEPAPTAPVAPPPASTAPVPPPPPAAPTSRTLRAIVIDAATSGIDPSVGEHVSYAMRTTLQAMGYEVLTRDQSAAAARRLPMPYPPSPADLWRVTHAAQAQRGAFARVWAHEGRYVIELAVASADGTGPFFARGSAGADDLYAVVERITREAMPLPATWDEAGAARYAGAGGTQAPSVTPTPRVAPPAAPGTGIRVSRVSRRESRRPGRRIDLGIVVEGAIGADSRGFYGQLVGAHFGVRLTRTQMLNLQLHYVNINGRRQRVNNILPMLFFENRIRIAPSIDLSVPLKFGVGFLPRNGAVLRFSGGLNLAVSERVELFADILSPTFWFIDTDPRVSFDVGLGVIFRL